MLSLRNGYDACGDLERNRTKVVRVFAAAQRKGDENQNQQTYQPAHIGPPYRFANEPDLTTKRHTNGQFLEPPFCEKKGRFRLQAQFIFKRI